MTFRIIDDPDYYIIRHGARGQGSRLDVDPKIVEEFSLISLEGLSLTPKGPLVGEITDGSLNSVSVAEIADSLGEWMCAAERIVNNRKEYLFFSDSYGYCPVFYSDVVQGYSVISRSFRGCVLGLERLGVKRTLNVSYYSALIASNTPTFQNSHSHGTMANEVKLLPSSLALLISKEGLNFIDRDRLSQIHTITDFDEAIKLGVQHSSEIISRILSHPDIDSRITLTGGVDSRLCLALALSSGDPSKLKVSTIDSRKWIGRKGQRSINRDIVISNKIREIFRLRWWSLPDRTKVPMDFRESLESFQSYRSNLAYTFVPNSSHTRFNHPVLTIRGGGGEILRVDSTMQKISNLYEKYISSNATQNAASWYADFMMRGSLLEGSLRDLALKDLISEFESSKDGSFLQRISEVYLAHRYRGHFGHQRQSTSANDIILHPLSNAYFLHALRLVSYEDIERGRVVKRIFELTHPELTTVTFANDEWSKILNGKIGDPAEFENMEWTKSYDLEYSSGNLRSSQNESSRTEYKQSQKGQLELSIDYLAQAFGEIETYVDAEFYSDIKDLHVKVMKRVRRGEYMHGYVVSKAASALESFHVVAPTGRRHSLDCLVDCRDPFVPRTFPAVDTSSRSIPSSSYFELASNDVTLSAIYSQGIIFASTAIEVTNLHAYEFAYYVYRGRERIYSRWYSDTPVINFDSEMIPGDYVVEVFARRKSSKVLIGKSRSDVISIE